MKALFLYIANPRLNFIDIAGCAFAIEYLKEGRIWSAAAVFIGGIFISAMAEIVAREIKP